MRMRLRAPWSALVCLFVLAACNGGSEVPRSAGFGPNPTLPDPRPQAIPTIQVAPAEPWADNEQPIAAADLRLTSFARGLDHPRWLYVLPNGDVLVAESNAPADRPGQAPTASRSFATRTMMESPKRAAFSSTACTRRSA
jgi:glucose/arabinose dehydrogenase